MYEQVSICLQINSLVYFKDQSSFCLIFCLDLWRTYMLIYVIYWICTWVWLNLQLTWLCRISNSTKNQQENFRAQLIELLVKRSTTWPTSQFRKSGMQYIFFFFFFCSLPFLNMLLCILSRVYNYADFRLSAVGCSPMCHKSFFFLLSNPTSQILCFVWKIGV